MCSTAAPRPAGAGRRRQRGGAAAAGRAGDEQATGAEQVHRRAAGPRRPRVRSGGAGRRRATPASPAGARGGRAGIGGQLRDAQRRGQPPPTRRPRASPGGEARAGIPGPPRRAGPGRAAGAPGTLRAGRRRRRSRPGRAAESTSRCRATAASRPPGTARSAVSDAGEAGGRAVPHQRGAGGRAPARVALVEERADGLHPVDEQQDRRAPVDARARPPGCDLLREPVDQPDGAQRVLAADGGAGVRQRPAASVASEPAAGFQDVDVQLVGPQPVHRLAEDGAEQGGASAARATDGQPGAALGEVELERSWACSSGRSTRPMRQPACPGRPG